MGDSMFPKRKTLDKKRAEELYNLGYGDQQIAEECGVTKDAVRSWRRRRCLPAVVAGQEKYVKKARDNHQELVAIAIEARAHGMTYGQYVAAKNGGIL